MNRIYKVIWSKAKQCKVVVSEIAKSCSSSCRVRKLRCLPLLLSAVISFSGFYYSVNASGWGGSSSFQIHLIVLFIVLPLPYLLLN